MRFRIHTLGCKINQYESQALREAWTSHGLVEAPNAGEDDGAVELHLVNTCAVTARAVADVRQLLRRLHRENPEARILVTGCAAQVMAEELAAFEGVELVVPQSDKASLLRWPAKVDDSAVSPESVDADGRPERTHFFEPGIVGFHRGRGVLKVQDGCSHRCTYCIVPLTRGKPVSREPRAALAEARRLFESGAPELMVSGVNLRQYGRGLAGEAEGWDFWDLLAFLDRELAEWRGRGRLRLSSLDPAQLDDKALETLANCSLVCPQLHVSLQSASPSVLKAMGRGHTSPEALARFLERLRGIWPLHGLGADILTGFPGEDEAAFVETLEFVKAMPLTYAHVFPYSRRPGTRAAEREDQTPKELRKERAAALRAVAVEKREAFLRRLLEEQQLIVAVEGEEGEGPCEYYASCRLVADKASETGASDAPGVARLATARPTGLCKDAGGLTRHLECTTALDAR